MQNGLQIAQATRAYQLGPCSVWVRHNPKPTLPVQAFARGLDLAPSCERLQAGLTEAGQALDGRALVAALGAAALGRARRPRRAAGRPGSGRQHGAACEGQRAGAAAAIRARRPGVPAERRAAPAQGAPTLAAYVLSHP